MFNVIGIFRKADTSSHHATQKFQISILALHVSQSQKQDDFKTSLNLVLQKTIL